MDMRGSDEISLILDRAFSDARELERLARRYRQRKLSRDQFIAAVEEISERLRQGIVALMVKEDAMPDEGDIPF